MELHTWVVNLKQLRIPQIANIIVSVTIPPCMCAFKSSSSHDHIFSLHLDSSLTLNNISEILEQVDFKDIYNRWLLPYIIGIPKSWLDEHIDHVNTTCISRKRSAWKHWLDDHPAPSWALIAEGLYQSWEHHILKQLEIQYPSGKSDFMHIHTYMNWFIDFITNSGVEISSRFSLFFWVKQVSVVLPL